MPLGKLIYMPEESTPTIATEGNREAVAYLELGEHTDHYGRLFASAQQLLEVAKEAAQEPCTTEGLEDMEAGCCHSCRARAAVLTATGGAS